MRRNFLTGLLLALVPTLLAAFYVGRGFVRESAGEAGFRRGIDLAGGTILVYQVDVEKTAARARSRGDEPAGLESDQIKRLAENLKRRIDPNDLKNVVVRPLGTDRVEIILPFTGTAGGGKVGNTEDFVQEVKNLVRQVGVLEFRILANNVDDRDAVTEAARLLNDPAGKPERDARAKQGLPPPGPAGSYPVTINNTTDENVRYEWVELGKEELDTLGLSNAYSGAEGPPDKRGVPKDTGFYKRVAAEREKAIPFQDHGLLYSRPMTKLTPSKDEVEGEKKFEYFLLTRVSAQDSMKVDRDVGLQAFPDTDSRTLDPCVRFSFNGTGANRFGKMTERNRPNADGYKRFLAIVMDDRIVSAPSLNSALPNGGQISGGSFDMAGVNSLVRILRSGALSAELKPDPVSENTVGATLGQDTIRRGLLSVGASFLAVLAFMVVYYRFAGFVACVALFVNLLLTVGFMVAVNAAFTLPGLAGIVLMLGMAVDANVLIYERIREEREKGANLVTSIRLGYDRAFATIIDTHLTSIFTSIVLYTFGNDNLKGFAVSLTVGLIISLFTSLYVTRLMFDYWQSRRWLTELRMMKLFARPRFNFMGIRHLMFAITGALTVLGLGLFLARGEAGLNVDFTKGTAYGGRLVDGQERALNKSADGKLGLLDLLGEDRQKQKLAVKEVLWLTKPTDDAAAAGGTAAGGDNIYRVIYTDGSQATVTFANRPDGATEAEQLADVKARAEVLPGLSVEQVYRSGDPAFGDAKARYFTVRTTEREKDLVQASLDRLLRDENTNEPLLSGAKVTDIKIAGKTATLTLDRPASPNYLKDFLVRELKLANRMPLGNTPAVEVTGVATENDVAASAAEGTTGQFRTIRVDVSKNTDGFKFDDPAKAAAEAAAFKGVIDNAVKAFQDRPIPDRLDTFDPSMAADTRNKALYAILASWVAILVFLWFRFGNWTFGLAAVFCLIHDLCFTLGAIAVCHYLHDTTVGHLLGLQDFKIDLAAVAALLTLVGYSVNDTIVVFDRIREVRGKSPVLTPAMINDSVNQTLSRTVLAALTVFLVVVVLYFFGGEGVHLFSFVMVMGVLVGTYSSIYIAAPLLLLFGEGKPKATDRPGGVPLPAGARA